jgi:hypothetical protein
VAAVVRGVTAAGQITGGKIFRDNNDVLTSFEDVDLAGFHVGLVRIPCRIAGVLLRGDGRGGGVSRRPCALWRGRGASEGGGPDESKEKLEELHDC